MNYVNNLEIVEAKCYLIIYTYSWGYHWSTVYRK